MNPKGINKETMNMDSKHKIKVTKFETSHEGVLLDEDEFDFKVSEMALKVPNEKNELDILKFIDETRANRLSYIKNSLEEISVAAIFDMFPRFRDSNGALINTHTNNGVTHFRHSEPVKLQNQNQKLVGCVYDVCCTLQ